jgi:tetratricopeptide (TPR) repeat protein
VGREAELASLEAFIGRCFEQPAGGAVLITGAPGIGKSRLRHELTVRLRAAPPDPAPEVWIGRGDPMSAGSPFGLLSSALQQAAGLRAGESLALRRARLRGRVERHVGADQVERVAEFMGELCGAPFADEDRVQLHAARQDAALMGDQMLRAWVDFVRAECAAHPVLLVLEDLHWGDAPTVRLVDAALRHTASLPFVVLALGRDEVDTTFGELWATRALMRVRLGQLSTAAGLALVKDVLGDRAAAPMAERLVERAGGNPFYLEELLRAVAAADAPFGAGHAVATAGSAEDARARAASPIDAPEALPETVVAMVATRLGAEDPENRRVLRAASIFGQIFWSGGVAALVGGAQRTAAVRDRLGDLVARELIVRRGDSRLAGQEQYSFRHGLVRDAAYAMLTDEDRVLGHRLAGDWLEQRGEESAIALAEHFYRGGEGGRAVRWFRRAAEQALEGGDFAAALARARRGIGCGALGEVLGALNLLCAEAYRWRGELGDAEEEARAAAQLLPRGSAGWFRAAEGVIDASGRRGDYAAAAVWRTQAAKEVASGDAGAAQVVCLCSAARQSFHAGRYEEASALADRVGELAVQLSDPRALAEAHRLRGARARHVGDLAGDVSNYQRSLQAFERAGDARGAANARVSLGFSCIELGDFDRAKEHLEQALSEADRLGLATVSTRARQNLALVRAARNELDEAERLVGAVIDESHAAGNVRFEGWTRIYRSSIALRTGDAERAEREADQAAEMLAVTPPARAGALASRARALLALARVDEAHACADEAMKVLEAFGGIEEFESSVWLAAAEAARASGDRPAAERIIARARDRLLARATAIAEADWRKSFLTRVPDNARILSLCGAWLRES